MKNIIIFTLLSIALSGCKDDLPKDESPTLKFEHIETHSIYCIGPDELPKQKELIDTCYRNRGVCTKSEIVHLPIHLYYPGCNEPSEPSPAQALLEPKPTPEPCTPLMVSDWNPKLSTSLFGGVFVNIDGTNIACPGPYRVYFGIKEAQVHAAHASGFSAIAPRSDNPQTVDIRIMYQNGREIIIPDGFRYESNGFDR